MIVLLQCIPMSPQSYH